MAQAKGVYRLCFINRTPYHEIVDFNLHVGHHMYYDQHCKGWYYKILCFLYVTLSIFISKIEIKKLFFVEHFNPTLELISKLEEALYNIQFEQHWLEAQTDRQALGKLICMYVCMYMTMQYFLLIESYINHVSHVQIKFH